MTAMTTVALVSCVKSKQPAASPAADLYTSALFRSAKACALARADKWFILSARHGLVSPETILAPYEKTLLAMPAAARKAWALAVDAQLQAVLPPRCDIHFLAGERYREYLWPMIESRGHRVAAPLQGKRLGEQLQWFKAHGYSNAQATG